MDLRKAIRTQPDAATPNPTDRDLLRAVDEAL
jgi:hypothetical protein